MPRPEPPKQMQPEIRALYDQLSPEQKSWIEDVHFLAEEIKDHLLLEQCLLAVDILTDRLQKLNPNIGCAQGCSRCCESYALPEVTRAEWELVQVALSDMPETTRARVQAQVSAIPEADFDSQGWPRHPRNAYAQLGCPLLIDGRCSVYAYRPLSCRAMGYFFSKRLPGEKPLPLSGFLQQMMARKKPLPLTCHSEALRIQTEVSQGQNLLLYAFTPLADRFEAIFERLAPAGHKQLLLTRLMAYFKGLESASTAPESLPE
ncbi:MAG: YkgJ family cysteine cluster protein [Candidatus Sericytochromatia bacterium]|nr:YkgJ family cysteine cluster protein [Candidatus Sericytochromatia bacterium]